MDAVSASSPGSEAGKLKEASEQFEAILIRQYLNEALTPVLQDGSGGNESGAHLYQHMITDVLANQLSQGSSFGVASLLQMQLTTPETKLEDTPEE